ncbi:MAG: SPASM domain-containing protein [Campylobacterales bacterium]
MDGEIITNHGFCHALSGQFGILADGRVVSCCLDASAEMVLGRIQEAP